MDERLRILVITPVFLPNLGGIEKSVYYLSNYLINHNCDVKIITPYLNKNSKQYEKINSVEIYRFCKIYKHIHNRILKFVAYNIFVFFYLLYFLIFKKNKVDIINQHTVALGGVSSLIISKLFKTPIVYTIHHYGTGMDITRPEENGKLLNYLIKIILSKASHIIVTSNTQKKYLEYLFGNLCNIPYSIIPLGPCNLNNFNTISIKYINHKYKQYENKHIIFSIGRIVKRKNYKMLIKIAEKLKNYKDIIFLIGGDGLEKDKLLHYINQKKIKNVVFLGKINDIEKEYLFSKCNLYIQCSLYEGFGISYIEALSHGIPILSYRNEAVGEIKEKIKHGVYIFDNIDEAIRLILYLKNNEQLKLNRERISKLCSNYYSWSIIAKKYYELFLNLILRNNEK